MSGTIQSSDMIFIVHFDKRKPTLPWQCFLLKIASRLALDKSTAFLFYFFFFVYKPILCMEEK